MASSPPSGAAWARTRAARVGAAVVVAAAVGGGAWAVLADEDAGPRLSAAPSPSTSPSASPSASATSASPMPTPTPTTAPDARADGTLPTVRRLRADDRWALSAAASRSGPKGAVPVVYLVSDEDLDLGWAAVPAAAARGGSVLLTRSDRLPAATATELERLDPDAIVLLGDAGAIASRVATAAAKVAPVSRVDDDDPAAVARAVTRAAFPTAIAAWVVSDGTTTDLAAAAATAAARRAPLVVVDEDARSLPQADVDLLADLGVRSATLVGDRGAVAAGVETSLTEALGDKAVRRADAGDRAALAARVHTLAWGRATAAAAYVANGDRPTDTFTGAVLAGRAGAPLYWSAVHCLPSASRKGVLTDTVARVTVLGGEGSVRSLVDDLTACQSTQDPMSTWVLVNKRNGLDPQRFVPSDLKTVPMDHANGHQLRAAAADALAAMAKGSVAAGAGRLGIDTAFRSYGTQDALYAKWLARRGRTWVDTWYLRPGYSEHQTGLTVDLLPVGRSNCTVNDCIDETPQGVWAARNAWRYGFILRYERGRTGTTGVGFEPWHFRYVGKDVARAYHEGGWHTYEEFLGRPAAPGY